VRSLSTVDTLHNGDEGGNPYTLLTSRVLSKHNLQQAHICQMLGSQYVSQYVHVTMLETVVVRADGLMHGLYNEGAGGFNDNLPDPPHQTQSQQHSTASMYNEADCDTPNYHSAALLQSRSVCHGNAIDIPGSDMFDADPLFWDFDQDHELNAWGDALAGVGEHLVDHTYQEYINHDELVVD
jgi:hypothetical protein